MDTHEFIPVRIFCQHHNLEVSFISSLQQFSLIEVELLDEELYIRTSQLPEIEKMVRLHNDLKLNTEGIDVVIYLLEKIKDLQEEASSLKSRLRIYE